jgi:hypothetical protein
MSQMNSIVPPKIFNIERSWLPCATRSQSQPASPGSFTAAWGGSRNQNLFHVKQFLKGAPPAARRILPRALAGHPADSPTARPWDAGIISPMAGTTDPFINLNGRESICTSHADLQLTRVNTMGSPSPTANGCWTV